MTIGTWSESDVETLIGYWCTGATGEEICEWMSADKKRVYSVLSEVARANNLDRRYELRHHDPELLLQRYRFNSQESEEAPVISEDERLDQLACGMSYAAMQEASRQFLALLEIHHGNGVRAAG